jgi:hypothetical protein
MKNKYRVHWIEDDGKRDYYDLECSFTELREFINIVQKNCPDHIVESVEEIIETRFRIDIDGVV